MPYCLALFLFIRHLGERHGDFSNAPLLEEAKEEVDLKEDVCPPAIPSIESVKISEDVKPAVGRGAGASRK